MSIINWKPQQSFPITIDKLLSISIGNRYQSSSRIYFFIDFYRLESEIDTHLRLLSINIDYRFIDWLRLGLLEQISRRRISYYALLEFPSFLLVVFFRITHEGLWGIGSTRSKFNSSPYRWLKGVYDVKNMQMICFICWGGSRNVPYMSRDTWAGLFKAWLS